MNTTAAAEAQPLALRPREAAKRLGVSESTLYRLRKAGKLASIQVGNSILHRVTDLEDFLKAREPIEITTAGREPA